MTKSSDRFYQLSLRERPAKWGDIGSLLKISGLIVTGSGAEALLYLPSYDPLDMPDNVAAETLSVEEWDDFIKRSDNPEILVGPAKIFHRKVRYEISGAIQQKVWAADEFKCMYCYRVMGSVQMTVDHFVPLELGGANDASNYLSACRKCNKDKGNMNPKIWCEKMGLIYENMLEYLKIRKLP